MEDFRFKTEFSGIELTIERCLGDSRHGTVLTAHYGYIAGTVGLDGEELDIYLNPDTEFWWMTPVYEITQKDTRKEEGSIDEFKYMLGYSSKDKAEAAYLDNIPESMPRGAYGGIRKMSFKSFKKETVNV